MNRLRVLSSRRPEASASRRSFLAQASLAALAPAFARTAHAQTATPAPAPGSLPSAPAPGTPTHALIDIHMHQAPDRRRPAVTDGKSTGRGPTRTEAQFLAHQRNINAVATVLLGANDHAYSFVAKDPRRYVRFVGLPGEGKEPRAFVELALKKGARGIGEVRYEGETPLTTTLVELARDHSVPILFHFQEADNAKAVYADFHRYIEKYPTVNFIGHAIDWWGAVDKAYAPKGGTYPRGKVTAGGLTDLWLGRYPNLYADLSATSGSNALLRDPQFARDFVQRHQDKLMFGSDCPCPSGAVATCWSVIKLVALNQLRLDPEVQRKIYLGNAQRLLGLKV